MFSLLRAQERISDSDVKRGLRMLVFDGVCSQIMGVLTGGAFLVQFAILLGASNTVIGLLAAVGPLTQILQIPAIYLIDRTRLRKALTVLNAGLGRLCLLLVAVVPFLASPSWRVPLFLAGLALYFGLGAVAGCAWNSWMRDFVPQKTMGAYFAKRLAIATAVGAALTLAAGVWVDWYKRHGEHEITGYSLTFAFGIAFGLLGLVFLSLTPEPRMAPSPNQGIGKLLAEPLRDRNFVKLLIFLGLWNFAINFSAPFFTVYMLKRLGLGMTWVTLLAVLSQAVNVVFFRLWGKLADRYTNKPVLGLSGLLFVITFAIWPFTTMPARYVLTIPLIVMIHVLGGMSTAGVAISGGNIALRLAPMGRATAYLAVNGLVCGAAATVAPLIAGLSADWFETQQLELAFTWLSGDRQFHLPAMHLEGLDFLFVLSFIFGLVALHRLLAVREEGEIEESLMVTELVAEVRQRIRGVSGIAGLRHLTSFPYGRLKDMLKRRTKPAADAPSDLAPLVP